jgi:cyclopropane fatty-acyl-phospholipid synthase-like methyltransferase
MDERDDANRRWSTLLSRWAIPQALIDAAPASPYFFDPTLFTTAAEEAIARVDDTISDRAAREMLRPGGTVLDVGVGAGAASLRLGASRVIGVDTSDAMLAAFAERAARLGIVATVVHGSWPDAAGQVPPCDVVVCHHVAYNVADLASFATALADKAVTRVVVELTAQHPMAWLAPYWEALHGLAQPDGPTADDAVAVLEGLGFTVHQERWSRRIQMIGETGDEQVARVARRLCLPPDRLDELRGAMSRHPPPPEREVVTVWW